MVAPTRAQPTERQLEIFWWVCQLDSQKCAAQQLGLGTQYVKNVCGEVYARLGVDSRLAALTAIGWLTLPPEPPRVTIGT